MEPFKTTTGSARTLLAAWDSADPHLLNEAIDQVCRGASDSGDPERAEILEEIGCTMREWLAGRKTTEDMDVCLSLLRHLAASKSVASKSAAIYSASSI
jgi:hypothetical protein